MPLPFQMADQFELLCVRPKETSLAAFHPFSASRPLPPQLHHDHHSLPPLNVPKGADILLPTTRKRPRKKLKMIIITLGLLATTSLALAPWVMAEDNMSESSALAPAEAQDIDVYDAIASHPSVQAFRSQVCQARSQVDLASRQLITINKERDIIAPLVEKGFEPRIMLLNLDARIEAEAGRKELAELAVNRMRSDLEAQQRKLASLENRYRADAETQLVEVRTRAAQAEARLDALKGKVAYTDVKAPSDGIISAVHIKTIGAVVDAGAVMAEIVPDEKEVTVRAQVLTDDVAKISPGQKVRVSLSAYDVSRYGALEGEVEKIASNSTQDENLPPYFVTMIKIPDPIYPNSGFEPEITPGMTAIIDVIGGKRTVLQYILSPIERAQQIAFREK